MAKAKNNKYFLRLQMVKYANEHGIRATARAFACSRNTVRRWLRRFGQGGKKALSDLSRAPKSCPHKLSDAQQIRILKARRQAPCFGPRRLKDFFGIKASLGAIARVIRDHGLTRKRRKKHQKKNDLRKIKQQYHVFERLQADTKPLYDICNYWPQMKKLKLPRHQYTMIDVKSGALFIDYANELSVTYATLSTKRILGHLKRFGVELKQSILSTDNGGEYSGQERTERERGFPAQVKKCGIEHRFLPPATPNAHANVESSHAMIEFEYFDLEEFRSKRDFFEKVVTFQRWWNFARPNYSKGGKTPAQFLEQEGIDPRCLLLTPIDLGCLLKKLRVGPHLPVDTGFVPAFHPRSPYRFCKP